MKLERSWSEVGTELVWSWYGVGAELCGVGELVWSWYGVGAELVWSAALL